MSNRTTAQREYDRNWYARQKATNSDYISRKSCLRNKLRQDNRQWITDLKRTTGCKLCDETEPCCLEYHHLDPGLKLGNVSNMVQNSSKVRILKEIKKCVLLCANCHRKVEYGVIQIRD